MNLKIYICKQSIFTAKGKLIWDYGSLPVSSQAASELHRPGISRQRLQDIRAEIAAKSTHSNIDHSGAMSKETNKK